MHLLSDLEQEQTKGHQPKDNSPYRGREGVPVELLCAGIGQEDGPALHGLGGGEHWDITIHMHAHTKEAHSQYVPHVDFLYYYCCYNLLQFDRGNHNSQGRQFHQLKWFVIGGGGGKLGVTGLRAVT